MFLKMISIVLITLNLNLYKPDQSLVQIFDVQQEKVVKQIPLTDGLEKSFIGLLDSSPKMYGGMDMNPKSGLILHVEFKNPIKLTSAVYTDLVKEAYLFLEPGEQPKSLIYYNTQRGVIVVVLKGDSDQFIKSNLVIP
ncbi:hypothetical protein SAMN04488542_101296 [Fontibacillus panacisegetis]|uniref:Uncharacterized protein n=1 Tax=Fontibacillus panacisegetis TaxID=670482 RepID=A0A1G7ER51_9BACL|nr:hypothetical protein [Fontibacillus panacisegetis]SDE65875.1 hypothetical protein SAMN04488542_101296 [Fontibacillus panacisegetis]